MLHMLCGTENLTTVSSLSVVRVWSELRLQCASPEEARAAVRRLEARAHPPLRAERVDCRDSAIGPCDIVEALLAQLHVHMICILVPARRSDAVAAAAAAARHPSGVRLQGN